MRFSALTVAGSDPGGGAGIQNDLAVFQTFGCWGASVVTALTVQDTHEVREVHPVPKSQVRAQLEAVLSDLKPSAMKTGMLPGRAAMEGVLEALPAFSGPWVLDPVQVATAGTRLMDDDAAAFLDKIMARLATLVTPNLSEAGRFLGLEGPATDAGEAAKRLADRWNTSVLVKGGHGGGALSCDALADRDGLWWFRAPRLAPNPRLESVERAPRFGHSGPMPGIPDVFASWETQNIPWVELDDTALDMRVVRMIPMALAERHRMLAVGQLQESLLVAFADPKDAVAVDAAHKATGLPIQPVGAAVEALERGLGWYGERVAANGGPKLHGAGCSLSAAVTARLAQGDDLYDAIGLAKSWVTAAIHTARPVGGGAIPLNHLLPAEGIVPVPAEPA